MNYTKFRCVSGHLFKAPANFLDKILADPRLDDNDKEEILESGIWNEFCPYCLAEDSIAKAKGK